MDEELNIQDAIDYLDAAAEAAEAAAEAFERERGNMSDEEIALIRAHALALKEDLAKLKFGREN